MVHHHKIQGDSLLESNLDMVGSAKYQRIWRGRFHKESLDLCKNKVSELVSSGVDVSKITVVRTLNRGGLLGYHPRQIPLLTQQQQE